MHRMAVSKFFWLPLVFLGLAVGLRLSPAFLKLKVAVELMGWSGLANVARETIATRTLGVKQTRSRHAYHRLLDVLSDVDTQYCVPTRRVVSNDDIAECHRLISHAASTGFRLFYETDLERPHFEPIVGPRMKTLGDNPDAFYYSVVFNPDRDFLVKGSLQGEAYVSFTVYEAECVGCFSQKVVADINHLNLTIDPKTQAYEFVISRRPKPANEKRDWLSIESLSKNGAPQLITRHYYELETPAQTNPNLRQNLSIERLNPVRLPPSPTLDDELSATKLERVIRFVRGHTIEMISDPANAPSWFSFTPNKFGPTVLFRDEVVGVGAVDIVYSAGPFLIEKVEEEGVLVEAVMPKARFANLVLWNKLLQTLAYEDGRPVSINRRQMKKSNLDPTHLTGKVKILISKRLPKKGLPHDVEWLDSEGRHEGTMFWRFLLPEGEVTTPTARVVKIDSLNP